MKKHLRRIILIVLLLAVQISFGQNEFFYNHYMFNPSYYNPAWMGSQSEAFLAAHHRTQWAGYDATSDPEGAPTTQLLSLVVPVNGTLSGFGVSVVNDRTGPLTSVQTRFSISASRDFNFGRLSIGVMPSLNVSSLNANFRPRQQGDILVPEGNESQFRPNLHLGLYYQSNKDYFIGVSAENVLRPSFDFNTEATNQLETNYLLMGGKEFGFTRDLTLRPTVLIRSDLNSYSYELSVLAMYQEKMWGGMAFRRSESISVLLGYSFLEDNKLKAGYSFDYVIKDRDAKEPTSHEVFIRYDLPDLIFGGRKAVKTPRFTF